MAGNKGVVGDLAGCVVKNKALVQQLKQLGFESKNEDGMTFEEAMICSQIASAIKGDLKAYKAIMSSKPIEKGGSPLDSFLDGNSDILENLTE